MQFTKLDITLLDLKSSQHSDEEILNKLNEKLEIAVGEILLSRLNGEQIDDFLTVLDSANQSTNTWLRQNVPDYANAIQTAREILDKNIQNLPNSKAKIDWLFDKQ